MNSETIKNKALSLVRLASESEVACIVCVRNNEAQSSVVDAAGTSQDLVKLMLNAMHHLTDAMPTREDKIAFANVLALGAQELFSQASKL